MDWFVWLIWILVVILVIILISLYVRARSRAVSGGGRSGDSGSLDGGTRPAAQHMAIVYEETASPVEESATPVRDGTVPVDETPTPVEHRTVPVEKPEALRGAPDSTSPQTSGGSGTSGGKVRASESSVAADKPAEPGQTLEDESSQPGHATAYETARPGVTAGKSAQPDETTANKAAQPDLSTPANKAAQPDLSTPAETAKMGEAPRGAAYGLGADGPAPGGSAADSTFDSSARTQSKEALPAPGSYTTGSTQWAPDAPISQESRTSKPASDAVPRATTPAAAPSVAPAPADDAVTPAPAEDAVAPAPEHGPDAPAPASGADAAAPAAFPPGTAPFGRDSAAPRPDGAAPAGFMIKGITHPMVYHGPDSPEYPNITAEVWFRTYDAAEASGFRRANG